MALNYIRYTYLFKEFIKKFVRSADIKFEGDIFVAVSGGADSMALLYLFNILNKEKLGHNIIALHVNHGTRKECDEEEEMIRNFCLGHNIELRVKKLNLGGSKRSNFEKMARELRYEYFRRNLGKTDKLLTAHHLDDSFEWSFMQQMKSSKYKTSLGIPLVHGQIIRPFLAVTRYQIRTLIQKENIPFLEDSSNDDTQYERNYVRKHIIPHLKMKYPKYLKHYAYRQNSLAKKLGISVFENINTVQTMRVLKNKMGIILIINPEFKNKFLGPTDIITKSIEELAITGRGKLAGEIQKLKVAFESSKKGPMNFSGSVKAYLFKGAIVLTSKNARKELSKLDEAYLEMIQNLPETIPNKKIQFNQLNSQLFDEFEAKVEVSSLLCIKKEHSLKNFRGMRTSFSLFPRTSAFLLQNNIWHQNVFTCLAQLNKLDSLMDDN